MVNLKMDSPNKATTSMNALIHEHLFCRIGAIEVSRDNTLIVQIADKERREKLEKEIAKCKKTGL